MCARRIRAAGRPSGRFGDRLFRIRGLASLRLIELLGGSGLILNGTLTTLMSRGRPRLAF